MVSFDDLNARLSASAATWTARQTPQFLLSDEQKARLLGVVVNDADLAAAIAPRAEAEAPNFAQAVDWRNRNGNHVTPVKDQAGCGSCVSFCTVATVESMASIELRQQLNLSEADLHFCSDHGSNCGGWWPTNAYNVMKNRGVADEACFPYPVDASGNVNSACASCADRDARAVKITESTTLSSVTERKNWLTNVGPCCAVIRVFDDFFAYGGGVYRHIMDNNPNTPDDIERGLHCVEIIGYSEAERCWIGKNSWGSAWGDQGFFKIGYGEIGIDTDFPFWTARGVIAPLATPLTVVEQHNLFRSADGHIHALWFNFATGWHHEDRSTFLPDISPAVGDPFGYAFIDKNSGLLEQHNLFRSADGHIHALWFNFATGWHHEDRSTFLPDIPPAVGDPFGYAFVDGTVVEQHNLFRSADGHIHALWFNFATGWHHEDRSTFLPDIPPAVGDPFGYAFIDKNSGLLEQHILFRSADGHIHALWFNFATGWHHEDRSTFLPDIPPAVGDPFGYAFVDGTVVEQHNLFRSADGHIHALWFNFATGWHHEDRSTFLPDIPPAVGDPFGYAFIDKNSGLLEQHNLFRSADGHIHALWFNFATGWHHEDRSTFLPDIPPAVGDPFGYAFVDGTVVEQHNLFRSADGHIHALWFNFATGWHHEDRSTFLPDIPPAVGDPFGYAFIDGTVG